MTHKKYDHSFRKLFSHRKVVEDLIKAFIHEDWIKELNFSTLETCKESYITDDLRERYNDIIWRIRFKNTWIYLYFLIEFQRNIDPWMGVRLMTYIGLFYQDLIASNKVMSNEPLPPILPFVFYNGATPWNISQDTSTLLSTEVPKKLRKYFPKFHYELLDVGKYQLSEKQLQDKQNFIVPIIELEQNVQNPDDLIIHFEKLKIMLAAKKYDSLRRAFMLYLHNSLELPKLFPNINTELFDLEENQSMLRDRLKAYQEALINEMKMKGLQQGIEEGRELGREQGIEQGIEQGMKQAVIGMLKANIDDGTILQISRLTPVQLSKLKKETFVDALV